MFLNNQQEKIYVFYIHIVDIKEAISLVDIKETIEKVLISSFSDKKSLLEIQEINYDFHNNSCTVFVKSGYFSIKEDKPYHIEQKIEQQLREVQPNKLFTYNTEVMDVSIIEYI